MQRQLVQRVGQRGQVRAQVGHLLLGPVAAASQHVGGDAAVLQRALVHAHVGGGAQQHHAVGVGERAPRAGQVSDPLGQQARLGRPPDGRLRGAQPVAEGLGLAAVPVAGREPLLPALLVAVGDQQLDARVGPRRLVARTRALDERVEVLAPEAPEGQVDRVQDLAAAAEVHRHPLGPALRARLGQVAAEDAHVGVAEAVDRLALVADAEQVAALQQSQQLVLERVGVLELVDHHVREALAVLVADAGMGLEQVARHQLQVVEVQARAPALELRVVVVVERHQLADQHVVVVLAVVQAEGQVGLVCLDVRLARRALQHLGAGLEAQLPDLRRLGHLLRGQRPEDRAATLELGPHPLGRDGVDPAKLRQRGGGRGRQRLQLARGPGRGHLRQPRAALALAAQVPVGGAHHVGQLVRRVRRQQRQAARVLAGAHEIAERLVEGVDGQPLGLERVQHPELGIQAGGEGVRAQHPRAETVDGGDPGGLGLARVLLLPQLQEPRSHAARQLRRGLLGEGDGQHRVDRAPVLEHRLDEPLDQHGRLARPGPGADQDRAVTAPDGPRLLIGELGRAHVSTRQIDGCEQPPRHAQLSGHETRSPPRMRVAVVAIERWAQSVRSAKSASGTTSLS